MSCTDRHSSSCLSRLGGGGGGGRGTSMHNYCAMKEKEEFG